MLTYNILVELESKASSIKDCKTSRLLMKNIVQQNCTMYTAILSLKRQLFWSAEPNDRMAEANEGSLRQHNLQHNSICICCKTK